MRRVHWRETLQVQGRTIESVWTLFKDTLSQTIEKNVPQCGIRTQLKNPCMTRYILRLIRRKRRKWKGMYNNHDRKYNNTENKLQNEKN
jgi:hypothetical protein